MRFKKCGFAKDIKRIDFALEIIKQMKNEINRKLLNSFEELLFSNFEVYCQKHQIDKNHQTFLTYLIDKELLNAATIKRYTIYQEFRIRYPINNHHKSKTIEMLADLFDLSTRHVWSLVKYGDQLKNKEDK